MSSRPLLNLLLVLVLLGLGLLAWFEPGKAPVPEPERLTTLLAEDLQRIEISPLDQPTSVLEKTPDGWRLTSPLNLRASESVVRKLQSLAQARSQAHYPAAELNQQELGLETPRLRVRLNDTLLSFGSTEALQGRRYVLIGDTVHLITDQYSHLLRSEPASLADPLLLPPNARLREIRLPALQLRLEEGKWLISGSDESVSADRIQQLVDAWRHARALRVSASGENQTGDIISLRLADSDQALEFIFQQGEASLIDPALGLRYHFMPETLQGLLQLPPPATDEKSGA